jgi:hypothetical protein
MTEKEIIVELQEKIKSLEALVTELRTKAYPREVDL